MSFADSTKTVKLGGGAVTYYENYTTTNLPVERLFGGAVNTLTVTNDSTTDTVTIYFDGVIPATELRPEETKTLRTHDHSSIFVRGAAGGDAVRMWGT